jgi:hypothetical protein
MSYKDKLKLIIVVGVMLLSLTSISAQSKFSMYTQSSVLNFNRASFALDVKYKLNPKYTISSWSAMTLGNTIQMGGDYKTTNVLLNYSSNNNKTTLSSGVSHLNVPQWNRGRTEFVIKYRVKLF